MTPFLRAFGVAVTVTVPEGAPVETVGIWLQFDGEAGMEFSRWEPRRGMALARSALPVVPRGTLIAAPLTAGAAAQTWKVDGLDSSDVDHHRVFLVSVSDES